jgi:UDP-N-acetylglucosamine 2-epimerase
LSNKLTFVLGIRPDVIRASLMLRELKEKLGSDFEFVWSGQHYSDNMKDVFFRQLDVPRPDVTLELDTSSDTAMIGSLIRNLGDHLRKSKPAAVVFLGDTNTVTGSLAVASLDIPIVHIEGCMRSYNWTMPEEKFRTTIDHISDVIYAYLPEYKEQGILEGIDPANIVLTGNPIVDVLEHYFLSGKIRMSEQEVDILLDSIGYKSGPLWTMTCHRRENIENHNSLNNILRLAGTAPGTVVFAAGYKTQREIKNSGLSVPGNVIMIDPIGYVELLELIMRSEAVLTDSGTVVEETAVLGVPSIQMRTSTERPQVYDSGGCVKFDPLVNHSEEHMLAILESARQRRASQSKHTLGDGTASKIIVRDLIDRLESGRWNGHLPNPARRPIERNFGAGTENQGLI